MDDRDGRRPFVATGLAIQYDGIRTVIALLFLLAWPAGELIGGAWCQVQLPPPGRYDFATMTWEDGVTDEMIREAGA